MVLNFSLSLLSLCSCGAVFVVYPTGTVTDEESSECGSG